MTSGVRHNVRIVQTGETYACGETETLLQGMARIGRKGIPVGCLSGGCGVCRISVPVGQVRCIGPMSRTHVSEDDEAKGICLACRVTPVSSVEVDVVGKLRKALTFNWGATGAARGPDASLIHATKET
ncbi:ferredoxin [Variovorax paradoxus]|uniref:2Fe-2S iron-sulfur cluster-binding protein n=1 Tax=Comamonadaceae TaxID=80864 RepID=UPI00056DAA6A|nr:2Fe-2S iron-sulfur cluster-binding protein [Xenophilus azovorans]KPU94334.1 ferredoxin [Variovorax paradoxus]MBN8746483.1 2Fe-2S iron-sulfur cluster binding domain-containing protein [Variovorax sp.]VTY38162.1 2Fe-2S iron-sulfur cluster binding domain protein [Xylophilus ampelinus]KPU99592.1 ferredoxin [Variovorax paradoxus]KPV08669.1 ferredoxin [Variovorax paradoxus]